MNLLKRLGASFWSFVNNQRAMADTYFLVSCGFAVFGPVQYAVLAFAFTACLYLRHLANVGQTEAL